MPLPIQREPRLLRRMPAERVGVPMSGRFPSTLMIPLGSLEGASVRGLVRQAIDKVRRCWDPDACVVEVVNRAAGHESFSSPVGWRTVTGGQLDRMLQLHAASRRLQAPAAPGVSREMLLHALAAGVSADALHLKRSGMEAFGHVFCHGSFLLFREARTSAFNVRSIR